MIFPHLIFPEPKQREDKPPADQVPPHILGAIEQKISSAITKIDVVYGGYSPNANYGITAANGRRYFIKGSHPGEMSHATETIRQEARIYDTVPVLKDIAPHFHGTVWDGDEDGWLLGIWDFIEPAKALDVEAVMGALVKLQADPTAVTLTPAKNKNYIEMFFNTDKKWRRLKEEPQTREKFVSLFDNRAKAQYWFSNNSAMLCDLQDQVVDLDTPHGLLHGDLRLDNIVQAQDGGTYVVDWPNACYGPLVFDLVFLAAHMQATGLMTMGEAFALYRKMGGAPITLATRHIMMAVIAGFFADQAYRAVPPRLPRLRWMQKSMLAALLRALAMDNIVSPPPAFSIR